MSAWRSKRTAEELLPMLESGRRSSPAILFENERMCRDGVAAATRIVNFPRYDLVEPITLPDALRDENEAGPDSA